MSKYLRFVMLTVIVGLIGCSAAYAVDPTVQLLSFDSGTSTFVYRVTQGLDATYPLNDFNVLGLTSATDPFTVSSPSTGGGSGGWMTSTSTWSNVGTGQSGIEYQWFNGSVKPGRLLLEAWVGDFTLRVPGAVRVPGLVSTRGATHVASYALDVPGFVPEPSSVLALGGMLLGISPLVLRLRKK